MVTVFLIALILTLCGITCKSAKYGCEWQSILNHAGCENHVACDCAMYAPDVVVLTDECRNTGCTTLFAKWNGFCDVTIHPEPEIIGTPPEFFETCDCYVSLSLNPTERAQEIAEIRQIIEENGLGKKRLLEETTAAPIPDPDEVEVVSLTKYRYIYIDTQLSYEEAQRYCYENWGTDLATINTPEDIEIALETIDSRKSPWIGLYSIKSNGCNGWFVWEATGTGYGECLDKESGACVDFWMPGHPKCVIDEYGRDEWDEDYQGDGYSFAAFTKNGQIHNCLPGNTRKPFLCNAIPPPIQIDQPECAEGEEYVCCPE